MVILNRFKIKLKKFLRIISIPRGHLILDVGSGDGPFARANVLCDKYLSDTEERINPIIIDRPFVAGDIMALPFRDKAFDYIYCSHVLEHVEDPERAIKELLRVGRRGFIEIPSEFLEKIKASPGHKWYVNLKNGVLIFKKKEREIFDLFIQEIAEEKLINKDKSFMNFYWRNYYSLFNIAYKWSGKIDFEIVKMGNHESSVIHRDKDTTLKQTMSWQQFKAQVKTQNKKQKAQDFMGKIISLIKYLIKSLIKRIYSKKFNLYELLACPICKGRLELRDMDIICYNCRKGFHIREGIPILIKCHTFDI